MAISLKNYLLAKLHEVEERHEYDVATETLRAWIDLYETEPQTTEQIDLPAENTVMWWLCRIADEEVRRKAVQNSLNYMAHHLRDIPNIQEAIWEGFLWGKTDEGTSFWQDCYECEVPLLPSPEWKEYLELRK